VPDPVRRSRVAAFQARIFVPENVPAAICAHEMRRGTGSDPADSLPVVDKYWYMPSRPFPMTLGPAAK
jgi:hypothetical protein